MWICVIGHGPLAEGGAHYAHVAILAQCAHVVILATPACNCGVDDMMLTLCWHAWNQRQGEVCTRVCEYVFMCVCVRVVCVCACVEHKKCPYDLLQRLCVKIQGSSAGASALLDGAVLARRALV